MNYKKTLAIFDLTDCEGCEVEFLSLRQKKEFSFIENNFDIKNWRLLSENQKSGPFDVSFIEGSPVSQTEVKLLKHIRKNSKMIIALGACASIGGIPAILEENKRKKLIEYVYGKKYKARALNAKPISQYITVDYHLSGCPVNPYEIKDVLLNIANDKPLKQQVYSVCLECKSNQSECLLLSGKPCLGPITKGGCGAICTSKGLHCYGCRGLKKDANFEGMIIALKKHGFYKKDIKKIMDIFLEESPEYQKHLKDKIRIKINI
jgi:sulfhydrogenase subunit delta